MSALAKGLANGTYYPLHRVTVSCASLTTRLMTLDADSRDIKGDTGENELEMVRHALALLSTDDPDWLHNSRKLAFLLWKRFQDTKRDALLIECIDVKRQILTVCLAEEPTRAALVRSLAFSLLTLFERTGGESPLVEAIDLYRESLSLQSISNPDRTPSCILLANALQERFKQTGDESLLTEAINLNKEALSFQPIGHTDRSASCANLAHALTKQVMGCCLPKRLTSIERHCLSSPLVILSDIHHP
jgi:hypothetical protein